MSSCVLDTRVIFVTLSERSEEKKGARSPLKEHSSDVGMGVLNDYAVKFRLSRSECFSLEKKVAFGYLFRFLAFRSIIKSVAFSGSG